MPHSAQEPFASTSAILPHTADPVASPSPPPLGRTASLQARLHARSKARQVRETITHAELTDLRAIQRTFDGAYARTALGQLGYAVVILRLFQPEFYWIGLAYTILAIVLVAAAAYRYNLAIRNEARYADVSLGELDASPTQPARPNSIDRAPSPGASQREGLPAPTPRTVFIKPTFKTAGSVVAALTVTVLSVELALIALVLKL